MKIISTTISSVIALSVAFCSITHFFPSPGVYAHRMFGTPEALKTVSDLYTAIETLDKGQGLIELQYPIENGFARTRKLPAAMIPVLFKQHWGKNGDAGHLAFGDVAAYYDSTDHLLGLHFYSSRMGCFASRSAIICPQNFVSLQRFRTTGLYVCSIDSEWPESQVPPLDLSRQSENTKGR
jgi:hypothetical protein